MDKPDIWDSPETTDIPESLEVVDDVGEGVVLLLAEVEGKEKGVIPGTPNQSRGN